MAFPTLCRVIRHVHGIAWARGGQVVTGCALVAYDAALVGESLVRQVAGHAMPIERVPPSAAMAPRLGAFVAEHAGVRRVADGALIPIDGGRGGMAVEPPEVVVASGLLGFVAGVTGRWLVAQAALLGKGVEAASPGDPAVLSNPAGAVVRRSAIPANVAVAAGALEGLGCFLTVASQAFIHVDASTDEDLFGGRDIGVTCRAVAVLVFHVLLVVEDRLFRQGRHMNPGPLPVLVEEGRGPLLRRGLTVDVLMTFVAEVEFGHGVVANVTLPVAVRAVDAALEVPGMVELRSVRTSGALVR